MKQNQNLETTVGIFLLCGIAIICGLIIFFGDVKDIFKPTYSFTVRFPDASGLLKGSDVYLSGAVIGKVTTDPYPIPDTELVEVHLKIDSKVLLRHDANFIIGSSGLLGDRFVDVQPKEYPEGTPESEKGKPITDGETIIGTKTTSLEDIAQGAQPLIARANDIAAQLDEMITRLNTEVFPSTSTADLKETIAKLRDMVDNGDTMIKNANDLLVEAKNGKGAVGRLINDKQVGDNLATFIANLKAHGPIFYKDDSAEKTDKDGVRRENNK
ncbi:MAG TPA: MlaD family protein [Candidatus Methylacidiphilales bacterium]|nr:MlaD family protein [Candidatus Methylacidiphilales bacterium]